MARERKDSGIAWIGEIPAEWELLRLKYLCSMQAGKNLTTMQISPEGQYPVYGGNGIRGYFSEYNCEGDCLLVGRQGALCGNVHKVQGFFWATEHAAVTRNSQKADFSFLFYLLVGMNLNQYASNVAAQPGLSVTAVLNVVAVLPPLSEQHRIAAFLDTKCATIDNILDKTRSSIEEYKRLKQSVITQAVTKGVRGKREMKDSGIEWVGEMPVEWDVRKLKYLGISKNGLTYSPVDVCDSNEGMLVIRSSNVKDGMLVLEDKVYVNTDIPENLLLKPGDIVICSRNGSKKLVGKSALVKDNIAATYGAFMMVFRCETVNAKYMFWVLNSDLFGYHLNMYSTVTINQLTSENMKNMVVPYCPDNIEQTEIAAYLDTKCAEIDTLIAKKEQLLAELESYKKSLIYEYVTGKKEVPHGCK